MIPDDLKIVSFKVMNVQQKWNTLHQYECSHDFPKYLSLLHLIVFRNTLSKYHFHSKNFCFSGWPFYWQRNYLRFYGLFEAMHSNLYTLGVITDIAQAFDTVDHTIFLKKPELHGLEGNAQNWIKSFLQNRKQ